MNLSHPGLLAAVLFLNACSGVANDASDAKAKSASTTAPPVTTATTQASLTDCSWKHPSEDDSHFRCDLILPASQVAASISFKLPEAADASGVKLALPDNVLNAHFESLFFDDVTGIYTLTADGNIAPGKHLVLSFMPASYQLANVALSACEFVAADNVNYSCTFTVPADYVGDRASFKLPVLPSQKGIAFTVVGGNTPGTRTLRYEPTDNTFTFKDSGFSPNTKYKFSFAQKADSEPELAGKISVESTAQQDN